MNVFVLGTGRCGTSTFIRACHHLNNFSAGHESRSRHVGPARFAYPDNHVEADNRLSWFLGSLDHRFPDAFYVHLRRDDEQTAASFQRRWYPHSIISAFSQSVLMRGQFLEEADRLEICRFYVETVTANINQFLIGRRSMTIWLHEAAESFPKFLDVIGADGDLTAAIGEWRVRHNPTPSAQTHPRSPRSAARSLLSHLRLGSR